MKRADITGLFPDATDEQISALMGINGTDINRARQGADDLRGQLERANQELETLRGQQQQASADAQRLTELEAELNGMKAAQATAQLREKVAKATGVPSSLLTGDTEEDCTAQAKGILEFARYPSVPDGGETHSAGGLSTRDQFAQWANDLF